jgi:hypothetical protein
MRYERTLVGAISSFRAQIHFPDREWANNTEPGLQNDNPNANQVRDSEPRVSHPFPGQEPTYVNKDQAEYDKNHKKYMRD